MSDGIRCIHCGYQETEHKHKDFVEGVSDGTLPKKDWPCDDYTMPADEAAQIEHERAQEGKVRVEYMEHFEGATPLGYGKVVITNRTKS